MTVVRIDDLSELDRPTELLDLVDEIQAGPPYSYRPGELPPASEWFAALVTSAELTLVALDQDPVGYCVALSWQAYGKLDGYAAQLGVDPATTTYLAELGVAASARRRGVASALLTDLDRALPPDTTACVIRTLADNDPAIALYERHGYQVAHHVDQTLHGRARVFLVRPREAE